MTGFITPDEQNFLSFYYESLCNDLSRLNRLYNNKSTLTISFENGSITCYTDNFASRLKNNTKKSIYKVLISNMVSQKIDNNIIGLNVLGQFVFSDKNQKRFSHNFILQKTEGFFTILAENVVILNEEIIYESKDFYILKINKADKTINEIINILEEYGEIKSIETKNEIFLCRMGRLDTEMEDFLNKIHNKGLNVLL